MNNAIDAKAQFTPIPPLGYGALRPERSNDGLRKVAPVIVLVVGLIMPPEFRVDVFGQTFYAYRIAWLLFTPWAIIQLLRGRLVWHLTDALVLLGAGWLTISFIFLYGIETGLTSGLGPTLDIAIPYLITRIAITSLQDFRRLLIALCPIFAFFAVLLPIEAYLQERFIRDAFRSVFGAFGRSEFGLTSAFIIATDTRFGFLRAMGPFSHPILAGLFFSSLLPLYHWSGIRGWPRYVGIISGFASVFTFSSAAMVSIILFMIMAIYDFIQKRVAFLNWFLFINASLFTALTLHLISQKGLINVIIRYTLNPTTGYYRLLIWEFGTKSVEKNPLFGIGYSRFDALDWMGDSIDAHFLSLAIRYGLPAALPLFVAAVLPIWACARAASLTSGPNSATAVGLAVTFVILAVAAFTVTYYGGMLIWFMVLLAIANVFPSLGPRKARPRIQPARLVQAQI